MNGASILLRLAVGVCCFSLFLPWAGAAERIVTAGSSVTEIVFALGHSETVVGVDTSSVYPEETADLPKIGYARMLSSEGLLSLAPTLLIATEDAGPESILDQVGQAGVRVELVTSGHDLASARKRVETIGALLGEEDKAAELLAAMPEDSGQLQPLSPQPGILFIYARAGGTLNVSGRETAADTMITLAGGRNVVDGYEGYKPLTAEAAVTASPEILLLTERGLADMGGIDGLLTQPGLALTPAGKTRRVVVMDDLLLLGFGPRLGTAIEELRQKIQGAMPEMASTNY